MSQTDNWHAVYLRQVAPHLPSAEPPSPEEVHETLHRGLRAIPKCELHCHLNGSVSVELLAHLERIEADRREEFMEENTNEDGTSSSSPNTTLAVSEAGPDRGRYFTELLQKQQQTSAEDKVKHAFFHAVPGQSPADRMVQCFQVFEQIYKIMDSIVAARLAVQDMLFSSARDRIVVLEIRTSLRAGMRADLSLPAPLLLPALKKAYPSGSVTKSQYVREIIAAAEHVLHGGLIDLTTGELLPVDAAAQKGIVPYGWWRRYCDVYYPNADPDDDDADAARKAVFEEAWRHVTQQMHCRLLLSVNRGASLEDAEETVAIARSVQLDQLHDFYHACVQHDPVLGAATRVALDAEAAVHAAAAADKKDEESPEVDLRDVPTPNPTTPPPQPAHLAKENVADRLRRTCWVTGIDLSGNCFKGTFESFEPIIAASRDEHIHNTRTALPVALLPLRCRAPYPPLRASVTLHAGEKMDERELRQMIQFHPERWGHLVFTDPMSMALVLLSGAGIEICITSNLLTGGHVNIEQHHLTSMLRLWRHLQKDQEMEGGWTSANRAVAADGQARRIAKALARPFAPEESMLGMLLDRDTNATDGSAYERARRFRMRHRLRLLHAVEGPCHGTTAAAADADREETVDVGNLVPNISLHTDDRGVFHVSLTDELCLASRHPGVYRSCHSDSGPLVEEDVRRIVKGMWGLQRLSLLQVFDLPRPVQLLAREILQPSAAATQTGIADGALPEAWRTWQGFVQQTEALLGGGGNRSARRDKDAPPPVSTTATRALAEELTCWEAQWLCDHFDGYYTRRAKAAA